ncbi:MAG: NAD(P)-dependent oxidoreductase [Pseudomonadota bacterium]
MATVGIAGLGLMGSAFAARLASAGHTVLGYDVHEERRRGFAVGEAADSIAGLAARCGTVLLAVFDTTQVEQVVEGPGGLLEAQAGGARLRVICTSTCDPERIAALAERCEAQGLPFLELPLSGTSAQVAAGKGVGLMGGSPALCAELSGVLDALCPSRHHIGTPGNANRAKLAVNLVLGLHRAALAEGLSFGERIGLDPARLLEVLQQSAAASSVMPIKGPLMVARRFDAPQSRVDQSLKDFGLIRALGAQHGQRLPLADVYVDLLESCVAQGEGALDNAVIYEAVRRCTTAA